jgi:hypothetical protein
VLRAADRLFWGVVFAAFVLAGTLLYSSQEPVLGVVGWALAVLALIRGMLRG